jgi:hypothetical protein
MFTEPLLTIAKMWKQPKCLLTDENAKKKKILQGWGIVQVVKPLPSNGKAPSSIRRTTINKRWKCHIYVQWNTIKPYKRKRTIHDNTDEPWKHYANKISQFQKDKYFMIPLTWSICNSIQIYRIKEKNGGHRSKRRIKYKVSAKQDE